MIVYDCFTFFNEIDLLKIRLNLLDDVVDYFVIVEMNKTQTGKDKRFYLEDRKREFSAYAHKIIYIKVEDSPDCSVEDRWLLENFQRNCIMRGLTKCQPDDVIMVSDLDEIPNPKIISNMKTEKVIFNRPNFNSFKANFISMIRKTFWLGAVKPSLFFKKDLDIFSCLDFTPVILKQRLFYYYMNLESFGCLHGTVIAKYHNMLMPQNCRRARPYLPTVLNGGWHFSYLGGLDRVKEKVASIVEGHDFKMKTKYDDEYYIKKCINQGVDLFGRKGKEFVYREVDINTIGIPNIEKIVSKYPTFFMK